jgi:hypothetical protein
LYFRATNADFRQWMAMQKDDSMGEVFYTGHKSTKLLPFQYNQAPVHNKSAASYSKDFCAGKLSDCELNAGLAEAFSRPHNGWTGSPSVHPGFYELDFGAPMCRTGSRHRRTSDRRRTKPELERTQILSSSDRNLEIQSSCHEVHSLPQTTDAWISKPVLPKDTLSWGAVDSRDCYKSTYGTDFLGKQKPKRCQTAPANASRNARCDRLEAIPDRPSTSSSTRKKSLDRLRPGSSSRGLRKTFNGSREARRFADSLNKAVLYSSAQ